MKMKLKSQCSDYARLRSTAFVLYVYATVALYEYKTRSGVPATTGR